MTMISWESVPDDKKQGGTQQVKKVLAMILVLLMVLSIVA